MRGAERLLLAGAGLTSLLVFLDWLGIATLSTLAFPAFLLATFSVAGAAFMLVAGWAPGDPLDLRLLDAGLVTLSMIAGLGLLLGTAGWLSFRSLAFGATVVAVAVVGAEWWLRRRLSPPAPLPDPDEGRNGRRQFEDQPRVSGLDRVAVGLVCGLVGFAVVQAVLGRVLRPPVGDPLAYHLPFAVEWLQRGSLEMPVPAAGDPSTPFYPLNSSLLIFWTLAPFESEILARYMQLPFLALLGLAAFRLGREVGLDWRPALVAAALAVTVPDIARSASLPENDLILAALLVAATAYLARLWRRPSRWRVAMGALALGLAAGTKVLALPFAGLLGIAWLAIVCARWRGEGARALGVVLATGAGLVIMLGGYSYVRNAIVMDNPLYPSGYVLAGRELFEGLYVMTWEWRRTHAFFPFDWSGFFLDMRRSFGWVVTWWTLPGFSLAAGLRVVDVIRSFRQRAAGGTAGSPSLPTLLLAWVPLTLLTFWFVIPYHFSRFLFPSIVWGIVIATWGFARLLRLAGRRFTLPSGTLPLLAVPFLAVNVLNMPLDPSIRRTALYWVAAVVVIGGVAGTWLAVTYRYRAFPIGIGRVRQPNPGRGDLAGRTYGGERVSSSMDDPLKWVGLPAAVLVIIAVIIAWPFYEREYEDRRFDEWRLQIQSFSELADAWEWVAQRTAEEPAVIAVAGTNEIYPLYGEGLDNRILTIWHSGELAGYGWGEPFVLYGEPDREAWLRQIEQSGVDYVYLTENVSFGGWPVERQWMMADAGRFELVYESADVEIWAVQADGVAGYTHSSGWIDP